MADTAAPAKGLGATLAKKIGPFPLGVWAAGGVGLLWYYEKKQKASASSSPAATQSQTGYGTDPAGNTGYIDPQTGYVYGSAEDISALQNEGLVGQNQYSGAGGTSGVGSTADTSATGSTGTPATSGTTTASGTGTATTTPGTVAPPVKTGGAAAPKSSNWQYPKPQGLAANSVSDSGFGISWSPVQGPNGQKPSTYTVQTYQGNTKVDQFISGSTSTKEYGAGGKGLKPATTYTVNVWANGGPVAPPHASIPVTTKPKGTK